jgi:Ni,Fe-hydrogenase I cytochrome b subunit
MDLDPALVQRIAETEITNLLESMKIIVEEHSSSFRWLIASFFAVNGGGVIAVAGQSNMPRVYSVAAGFLFCIGILLALLCAWLSQRANRAMLRPVSEVLSFWLSVAHFGELDQEGLIEIEQKMTKAMKVSRPTQFSGWFSVAAFSLGMCVAGAGYWTAHPPEKIYAND